MGRVDVGMRSVGEVYEMYKILVVSDMITNVKLQQTLQEFRFLWMVCAMLLMTQQTWGADAIEDTYRYSAMLDGMDQIRIKFPVYDYRGSSADTWAEGTVYIQVAGGNMGYR